MSKSPFTSKTIWFNALTILVSIATFSGYVPNQELANQTTAILLASSPAVNFLLRFITKKEIEI